MLGKRVATFIAGVLLFGIPCLYLRSEEKPAPSSMTKNRLKMVPVSLPEGVSVDSDDKVDNLDSLSLEELLDITISSAAFFDLSISQAPGAIQVFRLDDLAMGNVMDLADLLEYYAAGSSIGSHSRHGALHGVRGILVDNSAKTLLMVDGQLMNPRSNFGASLALSSPFLGAYQSVEVVNGPGAIIHGSGAINGFINLIPKTGTSHAGTFSTLTYGEPGEYKLFESGCGFQYGEGRDFYLYAGALSSKGYPADEGWGEDESNYDGHNTNAWQEDNYMISSVWNHDNFNLQLFFNELNSPTNNSIEPNPFYSAALGIRPKLLIELSDTESLELHESLFWHDHRRQKGAMTGPADGGGREHHWDNKLIFKSHYFDDHMFAFGGRYGTKRFQEIKQYFHSDAPDSFDAVNTDWEEYSLFTEDIWMPTDSLTVSAGLRYDKTYFDAITVADVHYTPEDEPGHYSPRVAVAYALTNSHNIKLSYQHGFRNPDAAYYQWFVRNNVAAQALGYSTAELNSESSDNYEFNYTWNICDELTLASNVFYNEYNDQLAWGDLTSIWSASEITAINAYNGVAWKGGQFQNIDGKIRSRGGELMVTWRPIRNTSIDMNYGYVELDGTPTTQRYPRHQGKLNVASTFISDQLTIGASYLYSSGYNDSLTPNVHDKFKDDRHMVDVFTAFTITKALTAQFTVKNLFETDVPRMSGNVQQPYSGGLGTEERMFYLSITYNF